MEDTTDPTDWKFGPLKDLDGLLRCPICFEYFNTAVMMPACSHNYCSLCIRRYLEKKQQCPTCSKPAVERDLKCNRLLDELLRSFKSSRNDFMNLVQLRADTLATPTLDSRRGRASTKTTPTAMPVGPVLYTETPLDASGLNSAPCVEDTSAMRGTGASDFPEVKVCGSKRNSNSVVVPVASEVKVHSSKRNLNGIVSDVRGSEGEIGARVLPSPAHVVPGPALTLHVPEPPTWALSLLDFESQEDTPPPHVTAPLQDVTTLTNELNDTVLSVDVPRGRESADSSEPREARPQDTSESIMPRPHQSVTGEPHPHQFVTEEPRPHQFVTGEPHPRQFVTEEPCPHHFVTEALVTEEPCPNQSVTEDPHPHQAAATEEFHSHHQSTSTHPSTEELHPSTEELHPSTEEPRPPTEEPHPPTSVGSMVNGMSVECPVCGMKVLNSHINSHLDLCLSGFLPPTTATTSTPSHPSPLQQDTPPIRGVTYQRKGSLPLLPKIVFSIMSDKQLRKKLKEYHLPAQGSRNTLIGRLKEFTLHYKAQRDSLTPKTVKQIAQEVESSERMRTGALKAHTSPATLTQPTRRNASLSDIEVEKKVHAESQNAHFSKLIAEMKGRRVGIGINGIATPPNTPTTDGGSPHSSTEVPGEERSLDLNGDFDTGMVLAVESPEALKRGGVAGDEDFDLTTSTIPESPLTPTLRQPSRSPAPNQATLTRTPRQSPFRSASPTTPTLFAPTPTLYSALVRADHASDSATPTTRCSSLRRRKQPSSDSDAAYSPPHRSATPPCKQGVETRLRSRHTGDLKVRGQGTKRSECDEDFATTPSRKRRKRQ